MQVNTAIKFYDVNAEYIDEQDIAELCECHVGEIIRIPSVGEIVEVENHRCGT